MQASKLTAVALSKSGKKKKKKKKERKKGNRKGKKKKKKKKKKKMTEIAKKLNSHLMFDLENATPFSFFIFPLFLRECLYSTEKGEYLIFSLKSTVGKMLTRIFDDEPSNRLLHITFVRSPRISTSA